VRIAVICPDAYTAWQFHRALLLALHDHGHEVTVIAAPLREEDVGHLRQAGLKYIPLRFHRFVNPRADIAALVRLYAILRSNRFDCVHSFNLKCHIYGSIVARLARTPLVFGTIEGLGFAYTDPSSLRSRLLARVVDSLNLVACRLADKVWFVNSDDLQLFVSRGILSADKAVLVRSCGVNLDEFSAVSVDANRVERLKAELGLRPGMSLVTMVVARAVWSKGVREFVEACALLERDHPSSRFVLLAPTARDSPHSVSAGYLEHAERSISTFRWLPAFRDDVRELLCVSDVVVLPSYYREGVPKILLEAMAMSKPIVTTDNVGCRDVVEDGKNGILVPVKDARAVARAIDRLLTDPRARSRFGRCSRERVEREFAEEVVVTSVLRRLYGIRAGRDVDMEDVPTVEAPATVGTTDRRAGGWRGLATPPPEHGEARE
jgi:N,N'-diacetylbacillosaminyl-diphospho-undecaprenol alpha-1,3-N-acetylgalactosaminyltransferase